MRRKTKISAHYRNGRLVLAHARSLFQSRMKRTRKTKLAIQKKLAQQKVGTRLDTKKPLYNRPTKRNDVEQFRDSFHPLFR